MSIEDWMYGDDVIFGPYDDEEGYSYEPVEGHTPRGGFNHHPDCTWIEGTSEEDTCICNTLWREYQRQKEEAEAEEMHEEYWS